MPSTNILANLFTTLYNTEDRRKDSCIIFPTSKLAIEVLNTLKNNGYIKEFEHIDDNKGGKFVVKLLAKIEKCGAVSPRFKVKKDEYNYSTSAISSIRQSAGVSAEDWTIVGEPEEVQEKINMYRERLGLTHLIASGTRLGALTPVEIEASVELLAEVIAKV